MQTNEKPGSDDAFSGQVQLGTERMSQWHDLQEDGRFRQLSYDQVYRIIGNIVDERKKMQLLRGVKHFQEEGCPAPWLIRGLLTELRAAIPDSFHTIDKVGGYTGASSLVFQPYQFMPTWEDFNPRLVVRNFGEGGFGRISGRPGTGKTNLACVIMEQWVKAAPGINLAFSNIRQTKPTPGIHYVRDARDLFTQISNLTGIERWLFILDEGGLVWAKMDVSTRRAKDLEKFCRVVRKMHGNLIIVDQRDDAIPTTIQQWSTSIFYCHEPGIVTVDLKKPHEFLMKIRKMPRTELPFDTYDIGYFAINISIPDILESMSGEEDPGEMIKIMLEAKDETGDGKEDRPRRATKA